MTLRHLEIIRAVAETSNFTKAAEKLFITQSAVSHAIHELEEQTQTVLFDRIAKKVQITARGQLLLERALPILAEYEELVCQMPHLERKAPIYIVSSITNAVFKLPKILQKFAKIWPDVPVLVEVVSAANAIEILRNGKADLAFLEGAVPQGNFEVFSFASYSLQVACAPAYPYRKDKLSMEEFCGEKLLLREKGSAIRDTLESALYLKGYSIQPVISSVNSQALLEAAKAGLGMTVLPDVLLQKAVESEQLMIIEVEGMSLNNDMFVLVHRDKYKSLPLKDFLREIEEIGK